MAEEEDPDAGPSVKSCPVPLRAKDCGLLRALSFTLMLPFVVPATVGLNVTVIVQFAPAFTVLPQLFVSEKSALTATAEMVNAALPTFVMVIVWELLEIPTS